MRLGMEIGAGVFTIIAAYFLYSGFTLATDIPNPDGFGTVANLQLMHIQSLNFATGIGSAIIAAILLVGSRIRSN